MKNRTGIILLTLIVTLLCAGYLSLTLVTNNVEKRADKYAQDSSGIVSHALRKQYLDSVWNEPVFHFLGGSFTYKELKEAELSLGLDLQGGMHVVLEVAPSALIRAMAYNVNDPVLQASLVQAEVASRSGKDFLSAFYATFQQVAPNKRLTSLFVHVNTRGRINPEDSDESILDVLQNEIDQAIARSFYILRARLDRFGTSQPNIQRLAGTSRIQIELPGVTNPERVRKLLQGIAQLSFLKVVTQQQLSTVLYTLNEAYLNIKEKERVAVADKENNQGEDVPFPAGDLAALLSTDTTGLHEGAETDTTLSSPSTDDSLPSTPEQSPLFSLLQANDRLLYAVKDTAKISRMLNHPELRTLVSNQVAFLWATKPITSDGTGTAYVELYAVAASQGRKPLLDGEVITDARTTFDQYGRPAISMQMNATGAKKWRKMTRDNLNERIAIVIDGRVCSAPVVESEIANGSSQITGDFTLAEAKDLANILKSGALPAPTQIVEDVVIGPTLGKQAQQQGITSMVIALFIVVVFMAMYYSRSGLVANLALAFNIFFILGILTQLNASLTLPGIAGIVLTMGMSIDANVLIFERIKEELRRGTALRVAIQQGYQRAYSSIVDSNVTTFLTATILYMLGQGPIKGFAITLMVGIICSFFTAVFLTRLVITWVLDKKKDKGIDFHSSISRNLFKSTHFAIIQNRYKAYLISGLLILLGLGAFLVKGGLNLGVDFLGGRAYVVTFPNNPVPSSLKTGLSPYLEDKSVEVKTYGADNVLKITTSYLIDDNTQVADKQVKDKLITGIATITGLQVSNISGESDTFFISSSIKVGAAIASDIKKAAGSSALLALVVIFLYIFARFRHWQFGVGALLALFHDVLVVLSVFALVHLAGFSFEVDQVFVAAMLTLIGYSINDTVIIFDRVRENMRLHPKSSHIATFNLALNETFSRTLITSATTLFVVLILFLFGGAVLRSFSFALVIGVVTGTYSSLFIAAATVVDLLKKQQKTRKIA